MQFCVRISIPHLFPQFLHNLANGFTQFSDRKNHSADPCVSLTNILVDQDFWKKKCCELRVRVRVQENSGTTVRRIISPTTSPPLSE